MWSPLLLALLPQQKTIWEHWLRDSVLKATESLVGSVIGAALGAWLAWRFSQRLFLDQTKAQEVSSRKTRALDRRLTEAKLVEDWSKALASDFEAIEVVLAKLETALLNGGRLWRLTCGQSRGVPRSWSGPSSLVP